MSLDFVNERLQKTTFFPEVPESCLAWFQKNGMRFDATSNNRIAATGTDPLTKRTFLALSDERLTNEILEWVRKYAQVPIDGAVPFAALRDKRET